MSSDPHQPEGMEGLPGPGDLVAGKYEIERVLGVGGMGVVVAAMHQQLQERVAIKILLPAMTRPETVARFAREARAAAKIKSEYIARVTDVGTLDTGAPYMVMEYLEGSDLSAVVHEKGALPVRDAVEYVLQACEAVAEAHALGIVHRDLKPANLFLARRSGAAPRVKVLDFGISKVMPRADSNPEDHSMTKTRTWLGSPLYMSPEQMRSAKDVDGRSDIWTLGLILFELLTGRVVFDATSFPDLCAQIMHGDPPRLEDVRPDAPAGLGGVIRRCLQKNVEDRYANVGELAMALVEFAPQRARSVAERAVSVTEAAGLMQVTGAPRPALDATLREPMMSPAPASTPRVATGGAARAGSPAARAAANAELAIAVTYAEPTPPGEDSRLLELRTDPAFAITNVIAEPAMASPGTEPDRASPSAEVAMASPSAEAAMASPSAEAAMASPSAEAAMASPGSEPAMAETGSRRGTLVMATVIVLLVVGAVVYLLQVQ
jgi:serine/threonine-protein kinase